MIKFIILQLKSLKWIFIDLIILKIIIILILLINNISILVPLILIIKMILIQIFRWSSFFFNYWKLLIVHLIKFSVFIFIMLILTFYSNKIFGTDWIFIFGTEIQLIIIFYVLIIIEIFLAFRIASKRYN